MRRPLKNNCALCRRFFCACNFHPGSQGNPDLRIQIGNNCFTELIQKYATTAAGFSSFDRPRFLTFFWETMLSKKIWKLSQSATNKVSFFSGAEWAFRWENGCGGLYRLMEDKRTLENYTTGIWKAGTQCWGMRGALVSLMGNIPVSLYLGQGFDHNTALLTTKENFDWSVLWAYCSMPSFVCKVREVDQAIKVTTATLEKIPVEWDSSSKVAAEKYPHGLPEPYTDDPTQWFFHGHPCASVVWDEVTKRLKIGDDRIDSTVLHIAVARLLGYRWPAELDPEMKLAPEMREVMKRLDALHALADDDGIVCIPALRQEQDAATRLLSLLVAAYGDNWNGTIPDQLLAASGCEGKSLELWLRDKFFFQHAKLFGDRPFIWQIWDGLRDGFSVLVNYHKLDNRHLNTLVYRVYSYLGDWINKQNDDIANGVDGAQEKLDAAKALKANLIAILGGESPYDIFVRWNHLAEQPVGWNPDLNDGVRLNIRPFVKAGVLREKPPKLTHQMGKGPRQRRGIRPMVQHVPW